LELPYCNTDNFQIWLNQFSDLNPKELKIVFLDNGAFHKAKKLVIPNNIVLVFIPPYCPELNPAEKIWAFFKRKFTNMFCNDLDDISKFISDTTNTLTYNLVTSTCRYEYINMAIADYF
jgi:transposase